MNYSFAPDGVIIEGPQDIQISSSAKIIDFIDLNLGAIEFWSKTLYSLKIKN